MLNETQRDWYRTGKTVKNQPNKVLKVVDAR